PHSVEAEQSLLGALLLDNHAFDRVADLVGGDDFYRDDHRRIWRHIAKLVEAARPADVVTVSESIEASEDKDRTGGPAYLGVLARAVELIDHRYPRDNPSDVTGVPTGFIDLDRMTAGLQPGDLIIIAGRPSMGKTALALNIAEHVAVDNGLPVAIFSMEMSSTQLAMRMLGSISRVDQHKMRTGRLSDKEWGQLSEAMGKLHETPIYIDEAGALTALEVRARARRLKRQYSKLGLIVIDYLQLMAA